MLSLYQIKKQLFSDPEILDNFILSEENVIEHIQEKVIIANELNNIEISKMDASLIAKNYYENNKDEIQNVIRKHFDYISDLDNWMLNIDFN